MEELKWPPTADFFSQSDTVTRNELNSFLRIVFSGKKKATSMNVERLINSIAQDICKASTNGDWKLPKHILLGMTLRHLYRSKQLETLLSRFSHCKSYTFTLELETAIANALDSLLTRQIVKTPSVPSIFHSELDNLISSSVH